MYKHYVRIDANSNVIDRYSEWEGKYQDGDILAEESEERHYNFPIMNERVQFLYRWDNSLIERSQAELDAEYVAPPIVPTDAERIVKLETDNSELNLTVIELWEALIPLIP